MIALQGGVVNLATAELRDDEGLADLRQLSNKVELYPRPCDVQPVQAFSFYGLVEPTGEDDRVRTLRSREGFREAAGIVGRDVRAEGVDDVETRLLGAEDRADEEGSYAEVVALHEPRGVRPRTYERKLANVAGEWEHAIVLEEHHALSRRGTSELLGSGSVDVGPGKLTVRLGFCRIKVP